MRRRLSPAGRAAIGLEHTRSLARARAPLGEMTPARPPARTKAIRPSRSTMGDGLGLTSAGTPKNPEPTPPPIAPPKMLTPPGGGPAVGPGGAGGATGGFSRA